MKEKIPRRLNHCISCETPFEPGAEYLSLLKHEEEGYVRADYCPSCWEKHKEQGEFWKGKIPLKVEKRQTPDERALALFRTEEEPNMLAVLALYLQRRGQVVKRSGNVFEIPETGEAIAVPKLALSPEEGREAGERLVKLLDAPST